ncbi:MAG: holo-ACP synthase [Rhodospirillaceae bacterium]|nr:holo-ACP synthase [Rhodospirillaceae bacterium]|tara:strand:- start:320 stop:712 length:393 start_codon:yes stop_codon:yes gene_type:complete
MIVGIGTDIINIDRIESVINRYGDKFINRVYSQTEIKKSESRVNRVASYAKRFAAKEACSKALGTGFRQGVFMKDLSVVNLSSGKPTMQLSGGALDRLIKITPKDSKLQIDLSITDEPPYAFATVIISIN